jgi:hypothetical protein
MPDPVTDPVQQKPPAAKKNERPTDTQDNSVNRPAPPQHARIPEYYYEFSQPDFVVSKIVIEHDAAGTGTITFKRTGLDEPMSDPIKVSTTALGRINDALAALDFLNSTESYQYERDYPHLGNVTIRVRRDGKDRTAKFNWTVNKDAKTLYDEYRKIGNQFIWVFDITVARENQPLDAPRLMETLDRDIARGEMSDPVQLVPLLKGLADDERIPLIARNRATKIVAKIQKSMK